jgi:uncharacterized protein YndB with AHSA1/START domain
MAATDEGLLVRREIEIEAAPEAVWEFLVDPEKAIRWMGIAANLDARPGGVYRVEVQPGHHASGEFVVVERPRRLVFTWGWEHHGPDGLRPGSTAVEFELVPARQSTLVRLTHRQLPDGDAAASHAKGWQHYLSRLAVVAAGGDAGPDLDIQD